MSCFSCGVQFNEDVNSLLRLFKEDYLKNGTVRYFYKESSNETVKICHQSSFTIIYEKYIKPNLQKGAEYSHISEYA